MQTTNTIITKTLRNPIKILTETYYQIYPMKHIWQNMFVFKIIGCF
jgi:hypothetical protein